MNGQQDTKKGFTIIEVVLVLAIAGLIFLMIFIAWPALQRSQRDTGRKNDVDVVAAALGAFRGNNRGKNPNSDQFQAFRDSYISDLGQYDKTSDSEVIISDSTFSSPAEKKFREMHVNIGTKCDADNKSTADGASSRQASIVILVEGGNPTNGVLQCKDA